MKKIQTKIFLIILMAIFLTSALNGTVSLYLTHHSTEAALKKSILESVDLAALAAQNMISTYTTTVNEMATSDVLTSDDASIESKKAFLDAKIATYYMRHGGLTDPSGYDYINNIDVSSSDFYKASIAGKEYMSAPYINEAKNDSYMVVSAPIIENDVIKGIVYFSCDTYLLQDIVENAEIGERGKTYILDKNGTIIAHPDLSLVYNQKNLQKTAQNDKDSQELIDIEKKMAAGQKDVALYHLDGEEFMQSYAPVAGTDGWSIAMVVSTDEFMQTVKNGSVVQLGLVVLILIIGAAAAKRIGSSIAHPITACANRLKLLAEGDLTTAVPEVKSQDESAQLAVSTKNLVDGFNDIIKDIDNKLKRIAHGDLRDTQSHVDYPGDFASLEISITQIREILNETLIGINRATAQVSQGSGHVADAAQTMSHGSTEQASSIEELAKTADEIYSNIRQTTNSAQDAKNKTLLAVKELENSHNKMHETVEAINDIQRKSDAIGKIIKTIEDIAFQTNILALNASVESARAGAAGKGFAVVADEVRNLANKSAEAAKVSSSLINETISAVHNGTSIVEEAAQSIYKIGDSTQEIAAIVSGISDMAIDQDMAVAQVKNSIDEISSVVQTNASMAEETAAASEELSGQALMLEELVNKFQLSES